MSSSEQMINNPKELHPAKHLKFYAPLAMLFVSLFIVMNIVSQKIVSIGGGIILTAGDFIYPLNYILSIILAEVYGYALSRRIIWSGFICNIIIALVISFSVMLPQDSSWLYQEQYVMILGRAPRLIAASLSAFLIGEFIGTYVLVKIKVLTSGKHLWFRSMMATLLGQGVDTVIFTIIAFAGVLSWQNVIILGIAAYWCKIIYQTLLTPGVYVLARFLKRREQVDIFDKNTNFNPFNLGLK